MKSLVEHKAEQEELEERLLRTGAIATYGARARKDGDASVRAFKQSQQALRKGGPDVALEDRVKRIEQALDHLKSKWGNQLDSFYDILSDRIGKYKDTDLSNWDPVVYK